MNLLTICPCCSNVMLYHVTSGRKYWFCRSCWQEMPDLTSIEAKQAFLNKPIVSPPLLKEKPTGSLT
ncbi:MAG: hypothetical protein D6756_02230 [Cyanobacteria bacterium J083]|nr:MAG: hypothetical protein D6756_02230 [Cyanobacteria bacterium J083]